MQKKKDEKKHVAPIRLLLILIRCMYTFLIIIILFYTTVQCLDSNLKVVNKKKNLVKI